MDTSKQAAQAKLINQLMQVLTTSTSLTAIELLGALETCKAQIAFNMMMSMPPPMAVPPSREPANGSIIKS